MKIESVELLRVGMPLVSPFRTSFGTQSRRDVLLVRVITPEAEGWAAAQAEGWRMPLYGEERDGEWLHFTLSCDQPLAAH